MNEEDFLQPGTVFQTQAERQRLLAKERLRCAAANLLYRPDGLDFLCWLLEETGVFALSYTGNEATFFNEGKRFIGIKVYRQLMCADPSALQKLLDHSRESAGSADKKA